MENRKRGFFKTLHDEGIDYIFKFLWEISIKLVKNSRVFDKKFKRFWYKIQEFSVKNSKDFRKNSRDF